MTEKPPYRVPLMAEVEEIPLNGLVVASTFSGAGGSCLGYRMAGMRVAWANEFEPASIATYRRNHPSTVLDERSIRDVHGREIVDAVGEVDVLDGSPPCQSFSMAGKRSTGWGKSIAHADGTTQRSDDLFFEYARLLGELRPRAFVAENVAGLVQGVAKGYFKAIVRALVDQGYVVRTRILDASWLGVPQARRRVVILGMRDDLGLVPEHPVPLPYRYSLAEACPWIVGDELSAAGRYAVDEPRVFDVDGPTPTVTTMGLGPSAGPRSVRLAVKRGKFHGHEEQPYEVDEPMPTITTMGMGDSRSAPEVVLRMHNDTDWGRQEVGPEDPVPTILAGQGAVGSNSHPRLVRAAHGYFPGAQKSLDDPALTATAMGGPVWGQVEERSLTIDEVKRICSFPDDFVLEGSYDQQWARLGNSVPPLLMRAVARILSRQLLEIGDLGR